MWTKKVSHLVIEYRFVVLALSLILTVFFAFQATKVKILTDLDDLAPQGHPYVKLDNRMNDLFGGHTLTLIGVVVKKGDIFNLETLTKIHRITRKILLTKHVVKSSVLSVTSRRLKGIKANVDGTYMEIIDFERLFFKVRRELAFMEEFKHTVFRNDQIYGPLVSKDKKSALILAEWKRERYYPEIFKALQKIVAEEQDENHEILLGGRPVTLGWIDKFTPKVLKIFLVTFALLFTLLFIIFRTIRGMLLPITGPVMGVIWGIGLMGLFQFQMDSLSILVPFLILAVGVSHAVQVTKRYDEEFSMIGDNRMACEEALSGIMKPALAAILADAAGFAALTLIPLRMIQGMAVIAAFGMGSLFFTVFLLHPVILSVLPPPRKEVLKRAATSTLFLDKGLTKVARFIYGKGHRLILAGTLLLIVVGIIGMNKMTVGGQQLAFWSDSRIVRDMTELNRHFETGLNPYQIYVETKEEHGLVMHPDTLREMLALQRYLQDRPEVGFTSSMANVIESMNKAFHADNPIYDTFPKDKTVGDFMELYFMGTDPGDSDNQIDYGLRRANISVLVKKQDGDTIRSLINDTQDWISKNNKSQGKIVAGAGIIGVLGAIDEELAKSQMLNLIAISLGRFCFRFHYLSLFCCRGSNPPAFICRYPDNLCCYGF